MQSTSTGDISVFNTKILEEAVLLLKKQKHFVIMFSPYIQDDKIMAGKWIDEVLQCKEDEEGFIVPIKFRKCLEEYKNCYREKRL
jgi:hypothetical protein